MKVTVNLEQVNPDRFHGYVQAIYNMMRMSDYVTTGEYFMTLYEEDLDELLQAIERITTEPGLEDPIAVENVMMLTLLLRTAEGSPDVDEHELHTSMGLVCTYAAMERLARMGEVEIFHNNMTSVPDTNPKNAKVIVRKL